MVKNHRNPKRKGAASKQDFDNALDLYKRGFTPKQITQIMGFSPSAINTWIRFGDWDKFCQYKLELREKYGNKRDDSDQEALEESQVENVEDLLKIIIFQLEELNKKWV